MLKKDYKYLLKNEEVNKISFYNKVNNGEKKTFFNRFY